MEENYATILCTISFIYFKFLHYYGERKNQILLNSQVSLWSKMINEIPCARDI